MRSPPGSFLQATRPTKFKDRFSLRSVAPTGTRNSNIVNPLPVCDSSSRNCTSNWPTRMILRLNRGRRLSLALNTDNFRVLRDPGKGGASHDFFAGRDVAFSEHKKELQQQLTRARDVIAAAPVGTLGYVKVTLRQSAWAKSHRPVQNLFKAERADLVGATGLGQMLFEVTPRALE